MKKKKLTPLQVRALRRYETGREYNETALGIHGKVYENLRRMGYVRRTGCLVSRITDEGLAALKAEEGME